MAPKTKKKKIRASSSTGGTIVQIPGLGSSNDPEYSSVRRHDSQDDEEDDNNNNNNNRRSLFEIGGDDEDDDDVDSGFHDEDDEEEEGGFRRSPGTGNRRRRRELPSRSSNSVVFFLWLLLMIVLGTVVVSLLVFRQHSSSSSYYSGEDLVNDNHEKIKGTNGRDYDDAEEVIDHSHEEATKAALGIFDDEVVADAGDAGDSGIAKVNGGEAPPKKSPYVVHYDSMPPDWDPFDLTSSAASSSSFDGDWSGHLPFWMTSNQDDGAGPGAYLMQPDIVNNTLVFVAEGDLYMTQVSGGSAGQQQPRMPAVKLTTTVGNVRTPRLHPSLPLVAFTATYTGQREVYVQDLRRNSAAQRITFWNHEYGISQVVGWHAEGTTLLVAAASTAVSLPDTRLYQINMASSSSSSQSQGQSRQRRASDDDDDETTATLATTEATSTETEMLSTSSSSSATEIHEEHAATPLQAHVVVPDGGPQPGWNEDGGQQQQAEPTPPGGQQQQPQQQQQQEGATGIAAETPIQQVSTSSTAPPNGAATQPEAATPSAGGQQQQQEAATPPDGGEPQQQEATQAQQEAGLSTLSRNESESTQAAPLVGTQQPQATITVPVVVVAQQATLPQAEGSHPQQDGSQQVTPTQQQQQPLDEATEKGTPEASPQRPNPQQDQPPPQATIPGLQPNEQAKTDPQNANDLTQQHEEQHSTQQQQQQHATLATAPPPEVVVPSEPVDDSATTPFAITPVPLSQALNGFYDGSDDDDECLYFTRFQQSSKTVRYVGGTAESLWVYCSGQDVALALTHDYVGTSKDPQLYHHYHDDDTGAHRHILLFLSDRQWNDESESWSPATMNLWALPLPENGVNVTEFFYNQSSGSAIVPTSLLQRPVPLTQISCEFDGMALQEYSVDPVTGHVVLRVGADLHLLMRDQIQASLQPAGSSKPKPNRLPVHVYSDFHETQERLLPLDLTQHFQTVDVFGGVSGNPAALLTVRGQAWVAPQLPDKPSPYEGGGQVLPERTYRLAPASLTGGAMRVLAARSIPLYTSKDKEDKNTSPLPRRWVLLLATDPLSPTAEHAFYLVPSRPDEPNLFNDVKQWPKPFLGGGDTATLGSVSAESVTVSPCGRRLAWTDTNGRICVMNLPAADTINSEVEPSFTILPTSNEQGEPLVGVGVEALSWSPGGRYLAINHVAANQFLVISLADCDVPPSGLNSTNDATPKVQLRRLVQVTPSRFNSWGPYWGTARVDETLDTYRTQLRDLHQEKKAKTTHSPVYSTLYFLTDRDVMTDTSSPWGTRMPLPHYVKSSVLYALPLAASGATSTRQEVPLGRFSGGGAMEVLARPLAELDQQLRLEKLSKEKAAEQEGKQAQTVESGDTSENATLGASEDVDNSESEMENPFPTDVAIDLGEPNEKEMTLARRAYRVVQIPKDQYLGIVSQTQPDGSFVLVTQGDEDGGNTKLQIFAAADYPSDSFEVTTVPVPTLTAYGTSSCGGFITLIHSTGNAVQIVSATEGASKIVTAAKDPSSSNAAVSDGHIVLSIWPALEYRQMYQDAWRMYRDYFWDADMHQVDWKAVYARFLPLVQRCTKREDLDDILAQMAAELSALHVFVYGGEYNTPLDSNLRAMHKPASLGATVQRTAHWKGYIITEIALADPDYNLVDDKAVYSPLSDQTLRLSGQRGLEVGDVIVGINGESVFQQRIPDLHMLLRGKAGHAVRLEVLRLSSRSTTGPSEAVQPEPVVVIPLSQDAAANLRYHAWEYKTRLTAKALAAERGLNGGLAYIHLRSMSQRDMNAFARAYFEDFDKSSLILDLRHNRGGNIDSWISSLLQRKPWSYFGDRTTTSSTRGMRGQDMHWDQHFAFRGHIVVLIDEKTSSDGEGMARSLSELNLTDALIGKRTWGGGIWLSSDNVLVDGGIATAPEVGVYNDKWKWGMGIEQQGVSPDIEVDNNPRTSFEGKDTQLERAIAKLAELQSVDPVTQPRPPDHKPDMSLHDEKCSAT